MPATGDAMKKSTDSVMVWLGEIFVQVKYSANFYGLVWFGVCGRDYQLPPSNYSLLFLYKEEFLFLVLTMFCLMIWVLFA